MAGIIGEGFVRVRPEMSGFRNQLRSEASRSSKVFGKILGAGFGIGIGLGLEHEFAKTIDKAKEAEVVTKRLQAALTAQGISWQKNSTYINENIEGLSKLSSFEDEELKVSFINILRTTNDVNEALKLNALAANVARGRGLSLTTVSRALARAYNGQTASLSRLGITVKKGVSAQEALGQVQAKYAGAAEAFATTAEGAQERLNKQMDDSREIIGGALLPVITNLTTRFADYLQKQNESGALQRKVNQYMKEGSEIAKALGHGFTVIKDVVGPLVGLVGGLGNALNLALGVKLFTALRGGLASFGLLSTSVARTSATGITEANAFSRAWDLATHPRNMIVNTTYTTSTGPTPGPGPGPGPGPSRTPGLGPLGPSAGVAAGAAGASAARGGFFSRFLRGKGNVVTRINQYGYTVSRAGATALGLGATAGFIIGGLPLAQQGEQLQPVPAYNPNTDTWYMVTMTPAGPGQTFAVNEAYVRKNYRQFWETANARREKIQRRKFKAPPPLAHPEEGSIGRRGKPTKPTPTGGGGLTGLQNLRLALSTAERTGDLQAQKRIQANIVAIYQHRVDTTKLTGAALYRFKTELGSEEDKAHSIQDQIDAEAARKASDRAADRDKRTQAAQKKQEKHDTGVLRRLERGRKPFDRAVQRAQSTAGTKDNIATAKALRDRISSEIKIVRASVQNTQTKQAELDRLNDEFAAAVIAVGEAKTARSKALSAAAQAGVGVRQEQLDKIIQIAQLTDDPTALQHALDAAIRDAKRLLKKAQASGKGILDAYLRLYGLQKQKRDALKDQAKTDNKQGTTAFDLLTQFGQQFQGGNLINADQPFVGPSGFVADIAQYMKRVKGGKYTTPSASTTGAGGTPGATSAIDRLIAALDRNTSSKNDSTTPQQGKVRAPKIDPHRVVSRGGGRYYESARARENVDTRGGV